LFFCRCFSDGLPRLPLAPLAPLGTFTVNPSCIRAALLSFMAVHLDFPPSGLAAPSRPPEFLTHSFFSLPLIYPSFCPPHALSLFLSIASPQTFCNALRLRLRPPPSPQILCVHLFFLGPNTLQGVCLFRHTVFRNFCHRPTRKSRSLSTAIESFRPGTLPMFVLLSHPSSPGFPVLALVKR